MDKGKIYEYLNAQAETFAALSDRIWDLAEIGMEEVKSSAALAEKLKEEGFSITFGIGGIETAFRAVFGENGSRIAFLGEFDALPNMSQQAGVATPAPEEGKTNGHGCGHHLLGTASAAAAIATAKWLTDNEISGTVEFYGCPAEENFSGKAILAKAGVFDGLDAALTWHPSCYNIVLGVSMLANYKIGFSFSGRAAHAASAPHLGRSALDAVELMNVGANYLREHIPSQARMHYAITDTGGNSANVVQAHARVEYIIRAPQLDQAGDIYTRLCDVAKGASFMTGTTVEIELIKTCANIINNKTLESVLQNNLAAAPLPNWSNEDIKLADSMISSMKDRDLNLVGALAGKQAAMELSQQSLHECTLPYVPVKISLPASSDVGDASWNVPTAQLSAACYAMGTAEHTWQLVAQGKAPAAHKGMLFAAKVMAGSAVDLFLEPQTLKQAADDFKNELAGRSYSSIFQ